MKKSSPFQARHIGLRPREERAMLAALELPSMETLISQAVPEGIRLGRELDLADGIGEAEALDELFAIMDENRIARSFLGQGYHGCLVPPVIQRNLFESPAWYTAYTPYQAEISQGRLEMLFHFQTLTSELTGLPVASASLLDEATALAEAAGVALRHHRSARSKIALANTLHPQVHNVLKTRMDAIGVELTDKGGEDCAALVIAWPDTSGSFCDPAAMVEEAKSDGMLVIVVADPMALVLLQPPAEWGADIVVGSAQRFGVPMGCGGPHAAFMGVSEKLTRLLPGRLVGQSVDSAGEPAYRLALQTREQHIRRDKATSNICTAQALLANMAAAYAIWHGPNGLTDIAERIAGLAARLGQACAQSGWTVAGEQRFDTVQLRGDKASADLVRTAEERNCLIRALPDGSLAVTFDETSSEDGLKVLAEILGCGTVPDAAKIRLPERRNREKFLTQDVFHAYRSETEMMRFLRRLADKDLALDRSMIPLGSCTMKLNASAEMMPVSWPKVAHIHPFAPAAHRAGYRRLADDLENWLGEITGFAGVSLQPNAGSQGEFAGLLAIRKFHEAQGDAQRNICLIPSSAHGTNPASAQMAGLKVVVVKCGPNGDVDLDDLKAKSEEHSQALAALMITYPSTHGVFEAKIEEICETVHAHGGQVYLDGANLNAMVGLARPGDIGADVCHMNLHKTFCIPHGGGGPGIGPIGVAKHLVPYLPGHPAEEDAGAVSGAPLGSASILPISWMYIRMMGASGLRRASECAILSANYLARRLEGSIATLFKGAKGRVAHECILDVRPFKEKAGVDVEDIAKRLIDYGFHAPTMSWPVAGTLMVEPTESESKQELDRFCDAMIAITGEIEAIASGQWDRQDNPLANAPHRAIDLVAEEWPHPYSRQVAVFPAGPHQADGKYWPPVARVDNVHGDRNLVCSCPPMEAYAS